MNVHHKRCAAALLALLVAAPFTGQATPAAAPPAPLQNRAIELAMAGSEHAAATEAARAEAAIHAAEAAATQATEREQMQQRAREELRHLQQRMAELAPLIARDEAHRALTHVMHARPMYGVVLQDDPERGVRLAAVTPSGPAARAGLRSGDRLLAIGGTSISGDTSQQRLRHARDLIGRPQAGQSLTLRYLRDDREATATVTAETLQAFSIDDRERLAQVRQRIVTTETANLPFDIELLAPFAYCGGDEPADCRRNLLVLDALRWRGLRMAHIDPDLGRYFGTERGALLIAVDRERLQPLRSGDVILEINDTAVDGPDQVMQALRGTPAGEPVELTILRERKRRTVEIEAPQFSRLPMPPAPPAPPPAPPAPVAPHVPPAPPAPPAPAEAPQPPEPPLSRGVLESVLL